MVRDVVTWYPEELSSQIRPEVAVGSPARLVAVAAVALILMAGCVGPAPSACRGDDCPAATHGTSGGPGGSDSPPITASLPFFAFDDCTGVSMAWDVPADQAAAHVPPAFRVRSATPGPFGELGFTAFDCGRVVYQNQTFTGVASLWSGMLVEPRNRSWSEGGFSIYAYDVLVSNQTIADALVEAGAHARYARFERQTTAYPGTAALEEWTWTATEGGPRYVVTFERSDRPRTSLRDAQLHHWFGDAQFVRIDTNEKASAYEPGVGAGSVEVTGPSKFRDAAGGDQTPILGSALSFVQWHSKPYPTTYRAGGT
jgi:hypothetical protein